MHCGTITVGLCGYVLFPALFLLILFSLLPIHTSCPLTLTSFDPTQRCVTVKMRRCSTLLIQSFLEFCLDLKTLPWLTAEFCHFLHVFLLGLTWAGFGLLNTFRWALVYWLVEVSLIDLITIKIISRFTPNLSPF